MAQVGFIGTGEIAAHMVAGLAGEGHQIFVSERNAKVAAGLVAAHTEVSVASNSEVASRSDILFLCLMAETARDVLPVLPFRPDHAVISVMADVGLDELGTLCGPATDIALTIPLPFIARGGAPLPVYPESAALLALFGARNPVIPVASEQAMIAHFGVTAFCAPIIEQVRVTADWLSEFTGDDAGAARYAAALFGGYLSDLAQGGATALDDALVSLDTEGGFNQTLRRHMAESGAPVALRAGLDAFRPRLGLPEAGEQ